MAKTRESDAGIPEEEAAALLALRSEVVEPTNKIRRCRDPRDLLTDAGGRAGLRG